MAEISTAISAWLEIERERFAKAARQAGIPPSKTYLRWVGSSQEDGSASYTHEASRKSSLNDPFLERHIVQNLGAPSPNPAEALLAEYGERCEYQSSGLSFQDDPTVWVEQVLLYRTRGIYIREIEALDEPDPTLAERLANELLELVRRSDIDIVTCLPVAGLRLGEEPLCVGNATIRRLRPEELGLLNPLESGILTPRSRRGFWAFSRPAFERYALEIRESFPKNAERHRGTLARRFVLAMQLLGFELKGSGRASIWAEPGPLLEDRGSQIGLSRKGVERDCSAADLERATALSHLIPEGAVLSPETLQEVALHRFLLGATRDEKADAVIDHVIALESVLLSGTKEGEYSFKFRLFGSHYLAGSESERREIYKKLRGLYGLRSSLVHGAKAPTRKEVASGAKDARELAGRMLVKALEEGWPSQEYFVNLTLGSGSEGETDTESL